MSQLLFRDSTGFSARFTLPVEAERNKAAPQGCHPMSKNRSLVVANCMALALGTSCSPPQRSSDDPVDVARSAVPKPMAGSPAPVASPPAAQASGAAPVASSRADQPRLAVEAEGLRWFLPPNGSARPLSFGASRSAVLASLERVRGKAAVGTNHDCGAGPVEVGSWADGLSVIFQRDRFVGWALDARAAGALASADNIGPGTTRSALEAAFGDISVRTTSLGTEFTAGGFSGVLSGPGQRARIETMWAGVNCVAR